MATDFSYERAKRLSLTEIVKDLCCEPLSFMWKNSLLSPRDKWVLHSEEDFSLHLRAMIGLRVRRGFMFLKRDQILYRCPFCGSELVAPVGCLNPDGKSVMAYDLRLARGVPMFNIPEAELRRELAKTKKRCMGVWPPKD